MDGTGFCNYRRWELLECTVMDICENDHSAFLSKRIFDGIGVKTRIYQFLHPSNHQFIRFAIRFTYVEPLNVHTSQKRASELRIFPSFITQLIELPFIWSNKSIFPFFGAFPIWLGFCNIVSWMEIHWMHRFPKRI